MTRPDIFNELRKLRNQIAHGAEVPANIDRRLAELGVSFSTQDNSTLTQMLLTAFGGYVPPVLPQVIRQVLGERSVGIVCDPWAGIGGALIHSRQCHPSRLLAERSG